MKSKHGATQKLHAKDSIDSARLKVRSFHRNDPNAEVTGGHIKVGEKVSEIRVNKSSCRGHKIIGLKTNVCVVVRKLKLKKHYLSLRNLTLGQIDNRVRAEAASGNTTLVEEKDYAIGKLSDNFINQPDKPVVVYKSVTEALAVVRSVSKKVPLVCLTDLYKGKSTNILPSRMTDIQEEKRTSVQHERNTDRQIKETSTMSDSVAGQMDMPLDSLKLNNTSESSRLSKPAEKTKATKKLASTNNDKTVQGMKKENKEIKNKDMSLAEIKSVFDANAVEKTPKSKRKLKDTPVVQKPAGSKEKKKSPKSKQETQPPEIVVTPPKDKPKTSRKSSESPTRKVSASPKKKKEEISPSMSDSSDKTSPKVRKRSASASPNSKKRSPVKGKLTSGSSTSSLLHVDIPDTDSGSPSKRTRSPNARFKEDMILYPWEKRSPRRSPSGKSTEKLGANNVTAEKEVNKSPTGEKNIAKQSPKKTFSPKKRQSQRKEKTVTEEPTEKVDKEELEPLPGSSCEETRSAARTLSFDTCPPKADGISSLITKDFKYKYQSSKESNLVGLSDLITKVSSSIESTDENLNALFGQAVEQDDIELQEQDSSISIDDSTDSDKTVTEFDSNSHELGEKTKEKDSELSISSDSKDTMKECGSSKETNDTEAEKGEGMTENTADTNCDNSKAAGEKSADEKGDNDKTVSEAVEEEKVQKMDEVSEINDTKEIESNINSGVNSKKESETNVDFEKNSDLTSGNDTTVEKETEKETAQETTNLFDMFGLKLKRKPSICKLQSSKDEDRNDSDIKGNLEKEENTEAEKLLTGNNNDKIDDKNEGIEIDDDVMIVSEEYPNKNKEVIVLSDDEALPSGNESDMKTEVKKPKFVSLMKNVEPKPLEILSKVEKQTRDKKSVFMSAELDSYLAVNKENIGPSQDTQDMDSKVGIIKSAADVEKLLENPYPDFDEIDDMVFLSFPCEEALNAHMTLERKVDWLHDTSIRKLAHLKSMKERQQDVGSKRMTDIKDAHEQKQNFRGVPMKLMKYNKMLKQELETILTGYAEYNEMSILKTPEKTSDITKIKGWKNKYRNAEDLQEAAGRQLSESGKLHWKTEERLLKNLDPDDFKDIGLELKKKRRKLINFSKKRGTPKSDSKSFSARNESDDEFDDYEVDDCAITEKDVYNEDDDRPEPEKILYRDKYLSQHKYGARKMFVKKMGLDARDEMILKKLGTQKLVTKETEDCMKETSKTRRRQCWFTVSKLTQSMAVAAVSALDKRLISEAKTLTMDDKVVDRRGRRRSDRIAKSPRKSERSGGTMATGETDCDEEEPAEGDEGTELMEGACGDEEGVSQSVVEDQGVEEEGEEEGDSGSESEDEVTDEYEEISPHRKYHGMMHVRSLTRKVNKKTAMDTKEGKRKDEQKHLQKDHCDQPGCRYGCICHLCKLSDSGEEKEADMKPPCDKEYCKLGCICESIDSKVETPSHCRKPSCMLGCKCPPKQAKPDIPKEHDSRQKKKKKGKKCRKKSKTPEKKEEDSPKDERITVSDDAEDWEPPNKKKRASNNSRFANLPRRESTYRLAKNLDAVSRKAMEVYATSEMYAEVKMRRRKSDPVFDLPETDGYQYSDLPKLTQDRRKSGTDTEASHKHQPGTSYDSRMETNVFEISDEESDSEMVQGLAESCRRTMPYVAERPRRYSMSNDSGNKKSSGSVVIDLVDSETEERPLRKDYKSYLPSSSESSHYSGAQMTGTVSEKMGLSRKAGQDNSKWKTQMVCLKAKKKTEDKSSGPQSEIKLLEIISNCNWENDRTNMLSKISHIISKDRDFPASNVLMWQNYCLHFLPQADKPAVIPPELKSKLPNSMYSIRIRITQSITDMERAENNCKDGCGARPEEEVAVTQSEALKQVLENDRKQFNAKLQKKLIDKIKFAEKLRDLIIAEEKKGSDSSKFSVSRDGIEKALKKYKTQLWKAYTGGSNMTLMQLKKAVEAAKTGQGGSEKGSKAHPTTDRPHFTPTGYSQDMNATLARIHFNQGLKIVCHNSAGGFIPLTNSSKGGITCQTSTTLSPASMPSLSSNTTITSTNTHQMVAKQRTQPGPISPATNNTSAAKLTGVVNPVTSGPSVTPLSDVLLIPVAENGATKWDPSANPVLSAKMTIMPNGNGSVSSPNGESVVNNPQGRSLIPMVPVTTSQPLRYPNPGRKQAGVTLGAPTLTGQPILLQSNQPGHSPIMINSIQPVSSSSPVYSSVQVISKSVNLTASPVPTFPIQTSVPAVSTTAAQFNPTATKQLVPRMASPGLVSIASPGYVNNSRPFTPPTTACSVYPIKLAPSSTNVTSPLPTFPFTQGAKCIGAVPFQILQTKDKSKIIHVLPLSSSGIVAVNSDQPITTVARQTGSPLSVINQQTSPNMQSKIIFNKKKKHNSGNTEKKDSTADLSSVVCGIYSKNTGIENSVINSTEECEESHAGAVSKTPDTTAVNEQGDNNKPADNSDTSADVSDIISLAKSAGIEIAMALNSAEKVDDVREIVSVESKKDLTDDDSDSCLIIDETVNTHQPVTGSMGYKAVSEEDVLHELRKRKPSPSSVESLESRAKKICHGVSSSAEFPVTHLANTEEDDEIDVMTFDMDDSDVLRPVKGSRRKAQHTAMTEPEDFEIERIKIKPPEAVARAAPVDGSIHGKPHRERCRRLALKRLFNNLSKVVLKYNPKLQSYTNGIPTSAVLQEARNLLQALEHKNGLLQECLDDGLQYHGSLRNQLQQHKDSMVKSGVPENVLNNFLKSVARATASSQGHTASAGTRDPLAEASDADLDYTPLSTADVLFKPRDSPDLGEGVSLQVGEDSEDPTGSTDIKPTVQQFTSILSQEITSDFHNRNATETKCQPLEALVSNDLDPESRPLVVKAETMSNDSNSIAGSDSQSGLAEESDEEIRSTTGYDSVFDQDLDFMESELLTDKGSEELVQSTGACEQTKTESSELMEN